MKRLRSSFLVLVLLVAQSAQPTLRLMADEIRSENQEDAHPRDQDREHAAPEGQRPSADEQEAEEKNDEESSRSSHLGLEPIECPWTLSKRGADAVVITLSLPRPGKIWHTSARALADLANGCSHHIHREILGVVAMDIVASPQQPHAPPS
ncbi:MAG: hypothetical protein ACYTHJ_07730 [Planctomycetota bacterium]|jgi:hypothetical protein